MLERAKTFLTVSVFTLLIWFAADLNVSSSRSYTMQIRLVSDDPEQCAYITEPSGQTTVQVTMYGRRVYLDEFAGVAAPTRVFTAALPSAVTGDTLQTRETREILRQITEIAGSHLSIETVSPSTLEVRLDRMVAVPSVKVVPDFGAMQVGNAVCTPTTVTVRLPTFAMSKLGPDPTLHPGVERLVPTPTDDRPESGAFQLRVPLTLETGAPVEAIIEPNIVTISGVLETQTDTKRIGPVQITFNIPPDVQERYAVLPAAGSNFRPDVYVTGPRSQLAQLDEHEVLAVVDIKASYMDDAGKQISGPVRFILPPNLPGLRLAPQSQNLPIEFTLVERPISELPEQ